MICGDQVPGYLLENSPAPAFQWMLRVDVQSFAEPVVEIVRRNRGRTPESHMLQGKSLPVHLCQCRGHGKIGEYTASVLLQLMPDMLHQFLAATAIEIIQGVGL